MTAFRALAEEKFAETVADLLADEVLDAMESLGIEDAAMSDAVFIAEAVAQALAQAIDAAGDEDRSAGRWCAECNQHGSHHTEKHAEFTAPALREAAEREALAGKVRALADEAKARMAAYPKHPHWEAWRLYEADLRDLLPTPHEGDSAEVGTDG